MLCPINEVIGHSERIIQSRHQTDFAFHDKADHSLFFELVGTCTIAVILVIHINIIARKKAEVNPIPFTPPIQLHCDELSVDRPPTYCSLCN